MAMKALQCSLLWVAIIIGFGQNAPLEKQPVTSKSWMDLGQAAASVLALFPDRLRKTAFHVHVCLPDGIGVAESLFLIGFSSIKETVASIWSEESCKTTLLYTTYKDGASYVLVGNGTALTTYIFLISELVFNNTINISKTVWVLASTESRNEVLKRQLEVNIPENLKMVLLEREERGVRDPVSRVKRNVWEGEEENNGEEEEKDEIKVIGTRGLIPTLPKGFIPNRTTKTLTSVGRENSSRIKKRDYTKRRLSDVVLYGTGRPPGGTLSAHSSLRENEAYQNIARDAMQGDITQESSNFFWGSEYVIVQEAVSLTNGTVILQMAGRWSEQTGLNLKHPLYSSSFLNFKGRPLTLTTVHKPRVFEIRFPDGTFVTSLEEVDGYVAEVIRILQRNLNFKATLTFTNTFGTKLANGSWNGMIGALTREEADLSPLDFSPSWARAQVVDFSEWFSTDGVIVVSQAPKPLSRPFLMLEIFSIPVWLAILGTGVMTGAILWFIAHILEGVVHQKYSSDEEPSSGVQMSLLNTVASTLKLYLTQGSKKWPTTSSGRSLSSSFFLVVISIVALYQGYIIAFLAVPRRASPINSAYDLMDRLDQITPIVRKNTVYYRFVVNFESFSPIAESLQFHQDSFLNTWDFFQMIQDGKYALIDTYSSGVGRAARFESRGEGCRFHVSKSVLKNDLDLMAHPQNSVFREQIDRKLRQLRSFGVIEKIKKNYYSTSCEKESGKRDPIALSLSQVQSAFYLLVVGLVLSIATFFAETISRLC